MTFFGNTLLTDVYKRQGDTIRVEPTKFLTMNVDAPSAFYIYRNIYLSFEEPVASIDTAAIHVLKDSSADPQAEAVETTGADAVAAAINADPDNWTTYNTTLVGQGGKVLEVRRSWVP